MYSVYQSTDCSCCPKQNFSLIAKSLSKNAALVVANASNGIIVKNESHQSWDAEMIVDQGILLGFVSPGRDILPFPYESVHFRFGLPAELVATLDEIGISDGWQIIGDLQDYHHPDWHPNESSASTADDPLMGWDG
jgi:hypothetical protein